MFAMIMQVKSHIFLIMGFLVLMDETGGVESRAFQSRSSSPQHSCRDYRGRVSAVLVDKTRGTDDAHLSP